MSTFTEQLIGALSAEGIDAEVWPTGGNCHAVGVTLSPADPRYSVEILATDGDAQIPDGDGGYVGLYVRDADPVETLGTELPVTVADFVSAIRAAHAIWDDELDPESEVMMSGVVNDPTDESHGQEATFAITFREYIHGVTDASCGIDFDHAWRHGDYSDGVLSSLRHAFPRA